MELQQIRQKIYEIRGQKVMLDFDLAELYEVETKRLNEAVKRNMERFPDDFMFQLMPNELENLRSQFATSSWGGARYAPYAFTEQGVAMLSGVLRSKKAVAVNIAIMRAFVALRRYAFDNAGLAQKMDALEAKFDAEIADIHEALRQLAPHDEDPASWQNRRRIGFVKDN